MRDLFGALGSLSGASVDDGLQSAVMLSRYFTRAPMDTCESTFTFVDQDLDACQVSSIRK